MVRWHVLVVAVAGCALTIVVAMARGATALAWVSGFAALVAVAIEVIAWLRDALPEGQTPRRVAVLVFASAVAMPTTVAALPAHMLGAAPTPSAAPSAAPPTEPRGEPTTPPAPVPTSSPTLDPAIARYCELAFEFLGHTARFSGKSWQGTLTKRDFDPIVKTAKEARDTAPAEMRAPMTVLASTYAAAQDGWSDEDKLANVQLLIGTILSPSAQAAADKVDAYESKTCF